MNLLLGDCLETLKNVPSNSVDSVVTDPPYGLAFMGKKWDYSVPSTAIWSEVFRVLKPGGHVLAFGGTRTYHRLVVNIEDAGFEIRDQIMWIYGSGFPKSHDVSKAIDKQAGAEREVIGKRKGGAGKLMEERPWNQAEDYDKSISITAPATKEAKKWQGWGTALKPANEPICLARKPLEGTVAKNVLKYGVGGLNIDASRVEGEPRNPGFVAPNSASGNGVTLGKMAKIPFETPPGRFPANILFDEEAAAVLDAQSGTLKSGKPSGVKTSKGYDGGFGNGIEVTGFGDSGGASRFFYVAKASKRERNAGLEGMPKVKLQDFAEGTKRKLVAQAESAKNPNLPRENFHPTVKPIKLMEYLVKLVTPEGGIVLDPFMGSGSTGVAAVGLGYEFIGCELSKDYFAIAKNRIKSAKPKQKKKKTA